MDMPTIEIDFEVFKALTMQREAESISYNDVIRGLLGLPGSSVPLGVSAGSSDAWICKGVRFPVGAEFRAHYKGKLYSGKVDKEGILIDGARSSSPSDAARLITHNNVNGWTFWECRFPGESRWRLLKSLRNGL